MFIKKIIITRKTQYHHTVYPLQKTYVPEDTKKWSLFTSFFHPKPSVKILAIYDYQTSVFYLLEKKT